MTAVALPPTLTCSAPGCPQQTRRPEPGDTDTWSALWDIGWRWRSAPEPAGTAKFVPRAWLYSCPNCPPVI